MDEEITDIGDMLLPYNKQVQLKNIGYPNGMNVLRLTFREGSRFTTIDLDAQSAKSFAGRLGDWAAQQPDTTDN